MSKLDLDDYNPLTIPDFDAGFYKGCPRKRRFTRLILDPFSVNEAIVVHYTEWVVMPNGEPDSQTQNSYVEPIASLQAQFNFNPTVGAPNVTLGMIILSRINNKLNLIND